MKKFLFFGAFAVFSAQSFAYSFAGDWQFDADFTINVVSTTINETLNDTANEIVTVSQTTTNEFSFPYAFNGLTSQGDFTVSGTTVTDVNSGQTTDPFIVNLNGSDVTLRVTYPTWTLTGEITGSNPAIVDGFGERAYEITGNPTTIPNIEIETLFLGNWISLGSDSSVDVNSWSMTRNPVPEPGTLLGLGVLGVVALRRKKK